ncbi:hypothetical protein [Kribbella sp. DT2]|uniref:hypothetical protein n=1 Tax=Kribbella sp. DT2 TaxID=3393427 RepID=UPI003CF339A2
MDTYGNNGWAGLASINLSGSGHISTGSVKLNDTYESGAPTAERQGVMCQEVGHTYGLDHQDTNFNNPNLGTMPAVALVAVAAAAVPAQANHSWGGRAVTVPLISSVTSGRSSNLTVAKNDWNSSPYIESSIIAGSTTTSTRSSCSMPAGQIRVCNYRDRDGQCPTTGETGH